MIPEWQILAICLGVPYDVIQSNTPASLGGLAALAYWRNGCSGNSYPSTWKFLLEKVDDQFGSVVAEAIVQKASIEPTWTVEVKDSLRQGEIHSQCMYLPLSFQYCHHRGFAGTRTYNELLLRNYSVEPLLKDSPNIGHYIYYLSTKNTF